MNTPDALDALRALDLPALRRRHLCALAATAGTDAERAQIVRSARGESYRNRAEAESELSAELDARRAWAARNKERPAESRTEPLRVAPRPTVHPVTVRYVEPTKTATARPERRPLFKKKAAPVAETQPVEEKPMKHGLRQYKAGCRCDVCKLAKKASRKPKGTRRPNGALPPHGTLSRYVKHRCRCEECRAMANANARKYRQKNAPGQEGSPAGS